MKRKHVQLVKQAVAVGILVLLITLFSCIRRIESVSEYFFARGLSRAWVFVFGHLTDWTTYSVFGFLTILLILAIVGTLVGVIVLLRKKERTQALSLFFRALIGGLCVICIYAATAGGCYFRTKAPVPEYEGEQLSTERTVAVLQAYMDDLTAVSSTLEFRDGRSVCPYTFDEIADLLIEEYKRLDDPYYSSYTPKVKKAIFSKFLSYDGLSGMTFQPTGESAVNTETPPCYLVVTAAHELAHAKGVLREREANLVAYYLLVTSADPYLRYCGYMYSLNYLTGILAILDANAYAALMRSYPRNALSDKQQEISFWRTKSGLLERIGDFVNDLYLKICGVKEGTANYGDPSSYVERRDTEGEKETVRITVRYSDTAKMLLSVGLQKIPA